MIGLQQELLFREHIRLAEVRVLHGSQLVPTCFECCFLFSEKVDWEKKLKVSVDTQKKLEEQNLQQEHRLKELEEALAKAEEIILSKDKVILDGLSCHTSASADGAPPLADVTKGTEVQSHLSSILRSAEESIRDLQQALDKREHLLKTYDQKLAQAIQVRVHRLAVTTETERYSVFFCRSGRT